MSHNRAGAKRGQAALNFWFFWFKPKERKEAFLTAKFEDRKGHKVKLYGLNSWFNPKEHNNQ